MADFNYTGGVRFAPDKVVDVTADKDGNPTKACNPITGVCLEGGGGESDFSTAKCTIDIDETPATLVGRIYGAFCEDSGGDSFTFADIPIDDYLTSGVFTIVLYKGAASLAIELEQYTANVSGNFADDMVTGDITITIRKINN